MLQLELHPRAEAELEAAIAWYDNECEGLGVEFFAEVSEAIDRIAQDPGLWRGYSGIPNVHRHNVHRFPYCILYRYRNPQIEIVAVAHQRRKPGYWSDRITGPSR